jgi:tetratricopeptide (TPR) repeat protein
MDIRTTFEQGAFLEVADAAALAQTPEDRLMVGISLFKVGRETDAMVVFRELADRVRDLARAFYYMALIHRGRGETDAAKSCIDLYLHFYPDDDEALDLFPEEDGEGAEVPPLMSEASPELAKIYADQGHYGQALGIYSRLLKGSDPDPQVRIEADRVQAMYLIKTLEGWLERTRK